LLSPETWKAGTGAVSPLSYVAEAPILEQAADQPTCIVGNYNRVGFGKRLQPRGEVRRFTDDRPLLSSTRSDQIPDNREPRGETDAHLQQFGGLQWAHCLDHRETRPHRPLGIVLMRLRIAEIDQHPVAHIFGDKAVEAADRLGDGAVVVADQLPQILRVKPRRERRRADQIAEHHR
jgi:hypothetical protein